MPWALVGSLVGAGGSILGGVLKGNTQADAYKGLADAYKEGNQLKRDIYNDTYANLSPYVTQGSTSLGQLGTGTTDYTSKLLAPATDTYGSVGAAPSLPQYNYTEPAANYQQSPGYDWLMSQGIDKTQNAGVAGLGSVSGNTLKALDKYSVGLASQDYNDYYKNIYNPLADRSLKNYENQYKADALGVTYPYETDTKNYWKNIDEYDTTQTNQYKKLYDLSSLGQNSAVQTGTFGSKYANDYSTGLSNSAAATGTGKIQSTSGYLGGFDTALTGLGSGSYSGLGTTLGSLFGSGTGSQDFSGGAYGTGSGSGSNFSKWWM